MNEGSAGGSVGEMLTVQALLLTGKHGKCAPLAEPAVIPSRLMSRAKTISLSGSDNWAIFGSRGSGWPLEKLSLLLSCLKHKKIGSAQMWYTTGLWQVWGGQLFSGGNDPSLLWSRPTDVQYWGFTSDLL